MKINFFITFFSLLLVFVLPNESNAYSSDPIQFITEIREKIAKSKFTGNELTKSVQNYIQENKLYGCQ